MNDNSPFLVLDKTCDEAINWITECVGQAGFQVLRTFDLQDSWNPDIDCPCPHHGTDQCDCEMAVFLVYKAGYQPLSIFAHGYDGKTWFWIVDNPQQRADPQLEASILLSIASRGTGSVNLHSVAHESDL